jgi:hypothetical protein
MESDRQKRKMVLASVLAAVAAIGLAASVSLTFASTPNQTQTTNTTNYIDCTSTNPPILNLPQTGQLKENGTTKINGVTYWYVTFIPGWSKANVSIVTFHGVTFTLTVPLIEPPKTQGEFSLTFENATELILKASGSLYCSQELPPIQITFADGLSVAYNRETVIIGANSAVITFDKPSSNPWFTQHTAPQAGVGYQVNGGEITLYVSTS